MTKADFLHRVLSTVLPEDRMAFTAELDDFLMQNPGRCRMLMKDGTEWVIDERKAV